MVSQDAGAKDEGYEQSELIKVKSGCEDYDLRKDPFGHDQFNHPVNKSRQAQVGAKRKRSAAAAQKKRAPTKRRRMTEPIYSDTPSSSSSSSNSSSDKDDKESRLTEHRRERSRGRS